jgi:hypothetical protein
LVANLACERAVYFRSTNSNLSAVRLWYQRGIFLQEKLQVMPGVMQYQVE